MTVGDSKYWYDRGLQTLIDIGWITEKSNVLLHMHPNMDQAFWNHTIENLWGRVWSRPGLTIRERQMVVLAVLTATGTEVGIEGHLKNCHHTGLTEQQVREIIMLAGYYAGWPKFSATMMLFNKWLADPASTWPAEKRMQLPGRGELPPPDETDYFALGLQTLAELGWKDDVANPKPTDGDDDPAFWDHTIENLWGRVWSRPGLSLRDRQIVVLATLLWVDTEVGMDGHLRNCHNVSLTEREVREIFIQAGYYAGWPKYAAANVRFNRILKEPSNTWPESARLAPSNSGERNDRNLGQPAAG